MVGKTILVVDENPASRGFLANNLREKQFKVLEASSAKEALITAWRDEPHLILFDPVLTDLKDGEFIAKLRSNVRTKTTPLIALSSDPGPARRDARRRSLHLGDVACCRDHAVLADRARALEENHTQQILSRLRKYLLLKRKQHNVRHGIEIS